MAAVWILYVLGLTGVVTGCAVAAGVVLSSDRRGVDPIARAIVLRRWWGR